MDKCKILALAMAASLSANVTAQQLSVSSKKAKAAKEQALNGINADAAKAHIYFLASDALEGRNAGDRGSQVAAEYIISLLRQWGIQPLGDSYRQPFDAVSADWQKRKPWQVHPDSISALTAGVHRRKHMANVLGMIKGRKSDEYVILGAHFDHIGADQTLDGDKIYNGADDNASGVSAALQIARAFATCGVQPERNIIFAFWDGEEIGLLGSKYFVQTCAFTDKIHGYLNFDMIGRNNKPDNPAHVVYFYTESHPVFGDWLKADIAAYGLGLDPDYRAWDKPIGGSDNGSFARIDIPIIWYHTDGHPDYHCPTDEADRINYPKVVDITKAAFLNLWNLANVETY